MRDKLSLEQFRTYRAKLDSILADGDKGEISEEELVSSYVDVLKELSSYDLGNIYASEWKDLALFAPEGHSLDFSGSNANFDLTITAAVGNVNLRGCNIINLDKTQSEVSEDMFDEQTKEKYSGFFLSDSFSPDFKERYYKNILKLDDLEGLTEEQKRELSTKDCASHFRGSGEAYSYDILERLGIDKTIDLVRNKEVLELVKFAHKVEMTHGGFTEGNPHKMLDLIQSSRVEDIEQLLVPALNDIFKKSTLRMLDREDVPSLYKEQADRLTLRDKELPDDVRQRYIERRLTISDIVDHQDAFRDIPLMDFISAKTTIQPLIEYESDMPLVDRLVKYKKVIDLATAYDKEYELRKSFTANSGKNDLEYAVKCFIRNTMSYSPTTAMKMCEELGYEYLKYKTPNDLLKVEPNTIIDDANVGLLVEKIGIKNLLRFEKETGLLLERGLLSQFVDVAEKYPEQLDMFNGDEDSFEETKTKIDMLVINIKNAVDRIRFLDYKSDGLSFSGESATNLNTDLAVRSLTYDKIINPEIAPLLRDKSLGVLLVNPCIKTSNGRYMMLYDFMEEKYGKETTLEMIKDLEPIFSNAVSTDFLEIGEKATLDEVIDKVALRYARKLLYDPERTMGEIPDKYRKAFKSISVPEDAPQELKDAIKNRACSYTFLNEHKDYIKYVKDLPPYLLSSVFSDRLYSGRPFYLKIEEWFGDDTPKYMMEYGAYIEQMRAKGLMTISTGFGDRKAFKQSVDHDILDAIYHGKLLYDENLPSTIKDAHPEFYLPREAPEELKEAFYNKKIDVNYLLEHQELLQYFDNTLLPLGFEKYGWLRHIYDKNLTSKDNNIRILTTISKIDSLDDDVLEAEVQKYILDNKHDLDPDKLDVIVELYKNIVVSNSSELYNLRGMIARELAKCDEPVEKYKQMEKIFVQNNLPTVGKVFLCFKILHPNFEGLKMEGNSKVSPVILSKQNRSRDAMIFGDLLKCTLGSNNRNLLAYVENVMTGSSLYERVAAGEVSLDELNEDDLKQLKSFSGKLEMLYKKSFIGSHAVEAFERTGNLVEDITELKRRLSPNGSLDYKLEDRVIAMYFGMSHTALTCSEVRDYMKVKVKTASERSSRVSASGKFEIQKGDLIKGIGDAKYLGAILQNGSVAKEFLGSAADTDLTPLDTDVSMVDKDGKTIGEQCKDLAAFSYGPIFFILKNDDRFSTTRSNDKSHPEEYNPDKYELFQTGVLGETHYGIRTGFASTDIDAIYVKGDDPSIVEKAKVEIAKNGFYIPIINDQKEVVFTEQDYKTMRGCMQGMSHYGEPEFDFSPQLETPETRVIADQIIENNRKTAVKREKIDKILREVITEQGYELKTTDIDGDLSEGIVELIDTGSTGRGTNAIDDGDFDFMVRLDRRLISDPAAMERFRGALRDRLLPNADQEKSTETGAQDFRYKKVKLDDETTVDIDLSFTIKTDKVSYSTDMALKDRLNTIKEQDPEKYTLVVANILLAKTILKKAGVYKPDRGDVPQGGLGGVGVENWILQNGGSFIQAAERFVQESEGKSFGEFQSEHHLWDFGENHMAGGKGRYPHDDFYKCNMSQKGYNRMKRAMKIYLSLKKGQKMDMDPEMETELVEEPEIDSPVIENEGRRR
jgi:hypothetical protein